MRKTKLGCTDLEIPVIAVGCMRMSGLDQKQAEQFVKEALDLEINFFDHADIYGGGECEEIFGNILQNNPGMRENMILQSKAGIVPGVMYDNSREYLLQSVEKILKRLHTDYLDVFLIHRPDALADPEETGAALDELCSSGKVRYVGVSNHRTGQMELLSGCMRQKLAVNQLQLSLTNCSMIQSGMEANMMSDGAVDRDGGVLDYCRQKRMTIQTWSPFQYGMFAGTFLGNEQFPELNQALNEIAEKYQVSNTVIAAAWILRHPANMQLIAGSMKISRLREIAKAADIALTREEWYRLYLAAGHILP